MGQQNLVLILARELADKLATATFVVDQSGRLVYFNEGAADILGVTFGEAGHLPLERWASDFEPVDEDGRPLPPEALPLVIALQNQKPSHRAFKIKGQDGQVRGIAVTAIPLFARQDEFVGAIAIFWEAPVAATTEAR
ncbi:MAG TPA: PAS domain-containing protein [Actinomycetota bacterium]